jgi:hypothetical protein
MQVSSSAPLYKVRRTRCCVAPPHDPELSNHVLSHTAPPHIPLFAVRPRISALPPSPPATKPRKIIQPSHLHTHPSNRQDAFRTRRYVSLSPYCVLMNANTLEPTPAICVLCGNMLTVLPQPERTPFTTRSLRRSPRVSLTRRTLPSRLSRLPVRTFLLWSACQPCHARHDGYSDGSRQDRGCERVGL